MNTRVITALKSAIFKELHNIPEPQLWVEWVDKSKSVDPMELANFLTYIKNQNKNNQNPENENKHKIETELMEQFIFFRKNPSIFKDLNEIEPESKKKCIVGNIQSGKTSVICGIAIYNAHVNRRTTIVLVQDFIKDFDQLARNFMENGRYGKYQMNVIYVGNSKDNGLDLGYSLSGETPSIVICLNNKTQIARLNKYLEKMESINKSYCFDAIFDEVDQMAYKKSYNKPVIRELTKLIPRARQFYGITATPFDMLAMENGLSNKDIYRLPLDNNYKGFTHNLFRFEPLNSTFQAKLDESGDKFQLSLDLKQFYLNLQNTPTFENVIKEDDDIELDHPIICLSKISIAVNTHKKIVVLMATLPEFKRNWTSIMYNGDGVWLYNHSLVGKSVSISSRDKDGNLIDVQGQEPLDYFAQGFGILEFKNVGIGNVLQYLRDNDKNAELFTHINIICGKLADRGTNFVSNVDYKWHLTHQLYCPSKTAENSALAQGAGRLCGIQQDQIPLTMCCTQANLSNILRMNETCERILRGSITTKEKMSMPELCQEIPIFSGDVPRKNVCNKKQVVLNKMARKQDCGYEEVDTVYNLMKAGNFENVENIPKELLTRMKNVTKEVVKEKYKTIVRKIESDKEWGLANLRKNLITAIEKQRETIVVKILRFFLFSCEGNDCMASKEEIINACEITNFYHYTEWRKETTHYQILIKENEMYKLNHEVVETIQDLIIKLDY